MDDIEALRRARAQFATRLARVMPGDMDKPTPCAAWDVRALIDHVVRGDIMALAQLRGADGNGALVAAIEAVVDDEPQRAFADAADELDAEFREAGVMERVVHHPVGDVSGAAQLGFRVGDYTYHAWDLARATGQDETLDPEVVEVVWAAASTNAARMRASGLFGEGASSALGSDAPLQRRLLDLAGRRP